MEHILRIYNEEILHGVATWDEAPWTMERRKAWFAGHDESTPVLVAEVEGEFAGFAYLSMLSDKAGWRFSREDTIYLDPKFHGQGIGKILLVALLEEGRRIGVNLVVASITSSNAASLALHKRLGFEFVGEWHEAGFKFGKWMDTTYLQKNLRA
jgi:phosphinothricin acetyltransferase